MIVPFGQNAAQTQLAGAARELASCNRVLQRYGLSLSAEDVQTLVVGRVEALETSDRVEFGGGVAKELVLGFAGSPHVSQDTFVETLLELQDIFYEFKNESLEQITDDELVQTMRSLYDDVANGDIGRLAEALLDGLGRHVREVAGPDYVPGADDAADPEADNALKNAYTLAAHRYDVSKWVDDEFRPAWEGSSWLDE